MNGSYKKSTDENGSNLAQNLADTASETGSAAMDKASDAMDAGKRKLNQTAETMKDTASEAMDEGRSRMASVMDKAQDAKEAIVAGAGSTMAAVRDVAVEKADAARETLSDVGDRLAATLQRSADGEDGDALKTRVLGSVAQGLTQASDVLRQRSVVDLADDVKTLARRHPGAFMAAAAVVGFAAARFVRSSAQRRMAGDDHGDRNQGPRV
ncbi:hypothetical protein [Tabrizicola aquatica]|jgi:hypothetical protein|uniref:hypothetical protein n=1 Tax=Tabrizicola aquatica TaxID=909926 RepID=UPI000CD297CD|nr:hypothetical protein [Tabrizicola aquatica]